MIGAFSQIDAELEDLVRSEVTAINEMQEYAPRNVFLGHQPSTLGPI